MAVSLYDMMRPAAIAAGLGVGCADERGVSLFAPALAGLIVGVGAYVIVARLANLWFKRLAGLSAGEGTFAAAYSVVFGLLLLTTLAGCYLGKWAAKAALF